MRLSGADLRTLLDALTARRDAIEVRLGPKVRPPICPTARARLDAEHGRLTALITRISDELDFRVNSDTEAGGVASIL